ncbi:MAG: hypothetical protein ACK4E8_01800 [Lacibacter sp.]|jgi:hypothetical protein
MKKNGMLLLGALLFAATLAAQNTLKPRLPKSAFFVGIEVGSKGVKMSVIEVAKNKQGTGEFLIVKDTSVNTDFISFSPATLAATLKGLTELFWVAVNNYKIPPRRVYTVVSSGVKMQAEKEGKTDEIANLIIAFQQAIKDPGRKVEVVDVVQEARLSHLGIVPQNRRYSTFLIDIGSGNTKGGYFPYGNTNDFKLFEVNWGTKSITNAAEKQAEGDASLQHFRRQLLRVADMAENKDIIYAVNASGAYPLSDNIAFSGGIAWSVATLLRPELIANPVVSLTYEEVQAFSEALFRNFKSLSPEAIAASVTDAGVDKQQVLAETKRVHAVFDQKSLMGGTALLLKIIRQFKSVYESKSFYFVKNGQVGWVSAYVDEVIE